MSKNLLERLGKVSDELLIPFLKITETIGLGPALKKNTWKVSNHVLATALNSLFKFNIEGRENVPMEGAAILCTQKCSGVYPFMSWVIASKCANRKVYQTFDNSYFTIPAIRSWLNYCDAIEVQDGELNPHAIEYLTEKLQEGELIGTNLFYDEHDGESGMILNEKLGILALDYKVPIIPIHVPNAGQAFNLKTGEISFNQKLLATVKAPITDHVKGGMKASELMEVVKKSLKEK
ncbi:hypothetical protein GF325_11795 [Candidatus Bathyarchaeota archaeon]|nr:hypothetical protein [Candidatus Bathyarchaeota archaeon]